MCLKELQWKEPQQKDLQRKDGVTASRDTMQMCNIWPRHTEKIVAEDNHPSTYQLVSTQPYNDLSILIPTYPCYRLPCNLYIDASTIDGRLVLVSL